MVKTNIRRNPLKLFVKKLLCVLRGVMDSGINVYISPSAELCNPGNISLGDDVVLESRCRVRANGKSAQITIGAGTTVYPYVLLKTNGGSIEIGEGCSINDYCFLNGFGGIKIGKDVHIAAHTSLIASEHDYSKLGDSSFSRDMKGRGIRIEDSVWIGVNSVILDGVTIGTGSVIGAGAVVTRDIPANSIAVGVPARVIKQRS